MPKKVFNQSTTAQLIGLSGTINAGKDTAANHLVSSHGFMHVSTGDILRSEALIRGKSSDRATLIEIAVLLRQEYGSGVGALVQKGIEQWRSHQKDYPGGLVISGLRLVGESQELKDQGGKLIFIDAPVKERYRRMMARGREEDAQKTFTEFVEYERIEIEGLNDPERPHLKAVEKIADILVENSGSLESFIKRLDSILGLKTK